MGREETRMEWVCLEKNVGRSQSHGRHLWADALFPGRGAQTKQEQERLEPDDAGSRVMVGGIQRRWGGP